MKKIISILTILFICLMYLNLSKNKEYYLLNNKLDTAVALDNTFIDDLKISNDLKNNLKNLEFKTVDNLAIDYKALGVYDNKIIYLDSDFKYLNIDLKYVVIHEYSHFLIESKDLDLERFYSLVIDKSKEYSDLIDYQNEVLTDYITYLILNKNISKHILIYNFPYLDINQFKILKESRDLNDYLSKKGVL
ncbi:hypothetical protein [Enterococcus italicus]|uniref:hypothetical protein n=1 Tax=Enterococcus italicus TaxID=246144 RepID=UPI000920F908|nr:hypothetical protein [Enterococcus italicus]OJG58001.1 hypothetical protein RT43_GL000919 [Enterococcus italicus DSM 15952]